MRERKEMKEVVSFGRDFGKCIEFHGNTCLEFAIGFQEARTSMERLGVQGAPDEELVTIVSAIE
jgi:formylmethanofuran dehydrogenase subunit E